MQPITTKLEKVHLAQLFRYFTVTSAKFAVLTNGRTFQFHTDLEEPNKLDARPFLTFDLSDIQPHLLSELSKFEKSGFDVAAILATAERLKFTSAIKNAISQMMENPSSEIVKQLSSGLYEGSFTTSLREQFAGYVKAAFREVVRDAVSSRLSSALAVTDQVVDELENPADEVEIKTTEEEREGYMIVKAIVQSVVKPSRVTIRDARSYCAVLIDNNNRKPLTRLHFNRAIKYVSLFDSDKEERVAIESLDQIYDFTDRLRSTASKYVEANGALSSPKATVS